MPREVTLFTDDGRWAAVVTAWEAHYLLYHDLGVRARVYRLGVPDTWGSAYGPWRGLGPWIQGPWKASGPWGAWGPWRMDGPWFASGRWVRLAGGPEAGPWGSVLPRSWVETPADSIRITVRFLGRGGAGEVIRERAAQRSSFLRQSESAFGTALVCHDAEGRPVRVERLDGTVQIVVDGVSLTGHVSTGPDEAARHGREGRTSR